MSMRLRLIKRGHFPPLALLAAFSMAVPVLAAIPVRTATPRRTLIRADRLPPPYATPSARNRARVISHPDNAPLYVPPGFTVRPWSRLHHPRFLTVAPNGDVFVAQSLDGQVAILREGKNAAALHIFARGLNLPYGIAFYPPGKNPTAVYVADTNAVLRFPYRSGDVKARGTGKVVVRLPGLGYNQHWTRGVAFSADGRKMYVSVGSRTNASVEAPPRAAVMEYNPDGTGGRLYASGLRNAAGLAWNPLQNALWAAVNERDNLGDDVPPDFVTSVRAGGFYGWPWYYIGAHHDPRLPRRPDLARKVIVPDVLLEAHSAALSVAFGAGSALPSGYKDSAYVALHGSWNRRRPDGYKVVRVPLRADGRPQGGYEDFAWGWRTSGGIVWGRPVGVAVSPSGAIYISDDAGNRIWRVSPTRR